MKKAFEQLGARKKGRGKKQLRERADWLWAQIVKLRVGECCEVCGKVGTINAHHIISRKNLHLRFDLRNGISLCPSHHTFSAESAHLNPIWFYEWLFVNRPHDLDYLRDEQEILEPNYDYQRTIDYLWRELDKLQGR